MDREVENFKRQEPVTSRPLAGEAPLGGYETNPGNFSRFVDDPRLQPSRLSFLVEFDYDRFWLVCRLKRAVLAHVSSDLVPSLGFTTE